MDSHLLAGAYSQQFLAKDDESIINCDRLDAIARAKRLSQETNKRRKLQAHKRKLQAKREEKRRHDILTRRKEEQRQATEKYQRSHLPPSARQSYRLVQRRPDGAALDEALQMIRGVPHYNRYMSSLERVLSDTNENKDPLEVSFHKPRPHSTRPGSGRLTYQLSSRERADMMNYSKQNMTASKTLFEQMLEQQQSLHLEQQQMSLQEFNHALHREIDGEKAFGKTANDHSADSDAQDSEGNITHSNSCSSLDSLEESNGSDPEYERPSNPRNALTQLRQRPASAYHVTGYEHNINENTVVSSQHQQPELKLQQQRLKNLSLLGEQTVPSYPQNQNISAYAAYKKNGAVTEIPKTETRLITENSDYPNPKQQPSTSYNGLTSNSETQHNKEKVVSGNDKFTVEQNCQLPLKQISTDSLESSSTISSIPVHPLTGVARECSRGNDSLQSEGTENRNKVHISNINSKINIAMNNAESSKQQQSDKFISAQKFASSPPNNVSNVSIQPGAWITPSSVENITPFTDFPGNENKINVGSVQPRYASVIGVTVMPGYNVLDQKATSVNSTLPLVPATTSLPVSSISNTIAYSKAGTRVDTVTRLGTFSTITNNEMNKDFSNLDKHELTYPHIHDYQDLENIHQSSSQKQAQISSTKQTNNYQGQIKVPSNPAIREDIGSAGLLPPSKQTNMQVSTVQHFLSSPSNTPTYPLSQGQDTGLQPYMHQDAQYYYTQNGNVPDSSFIVRRNLPTSRPPSPVAYAANKVDQPNKSFMQAGPQLVNTVGEHEVPTSDQVSVSRSHKAYTSEISKEYVEDEVLIDEDYDEMRPLRGILKQAAVKVTAQAQEKSAASKAYLRDSLELAHVQNDKKIKKKSVRFASHHIDEDGNESDNAEHIEENWSFAGLTGYKNTINRPVSAKFASSTKPEASTRVQRAFSAGSIRQQPAVTSEIIQIKNGQQISSSSTAATTVESTNPVYSRIHGQRSNLPPSFVNPLNTTPINRPKAAAHIIMSTDIHKEASTGCDATHAGPSTIHKSYLETKVRSANDNFLSKLPVKIPTSKESNAMVYNVAFAQNEENGNINANTSGIHDPREDIVNQNSKERQQQQNCDKSINAYSGSKLAPSSNSGVRRATAVPASSKVTYAQSHGGTPSFSTSAGNAVYDETGVRIDRTPTDEEITWLWDKVRNCLNRESGNKSHSSVNVNSDQAPRQPPTLSTKLIDGAALGFGTYKNGDTGGVKPGVFNPRTASTLKINNTVGPVVQQQGGYLKRYGLLKQRRASSASAIRNNNGSDGQKAGSVTYGRTSTIQPHQPSSGTGQPQQRDIPTPMAYGYKPQDEVSESTAEFLMAERLSRKSLSDSHIHLAMDDAHSKQEAYNRSRMTEARNGHSALSLEEHKLLESLDRLNQKLKESKFNGNNYHYHQHNQAQLPAFPGHRPIIDSRRHNLTSPAAQQRAQSARTRQNVYQYR